MLVRKVNLALCEIDLLTVQQQRCMISRKSETLRKSIRRNVRMEIKKSAHIIPPCPKCPYKLGLIKTFINPSL